MGFLISLEMLDNRYIQLMINDDVEERGRGQRSIFGFMYF